MPAYQNSSSETSTSTRDGDRLTVTGTLCFTYEASGAMEAARSAYLATMAKRRWKLGLRLLPGQRLERLAFEGRTGDVVMRPDDEVTRELNEAFPCPGEVWVGLVPSEGERRYRWQDTGLLTICYRFTLVLTGVRCLPAALVLVLTYGNIRFSVHHLVHVLLLTEIPGGRTRVAAIVDVEKRRIARPTAWELAVRRQAAPAARPKAQPGARRRKPTKKRRR